MITLRLFVVCTVLFLLIGCGNADPLPDPTATAAPTNAPQPTDPIEPTETPVPTIGPTATATTPPTATPMPTDVPLVPLVSAESQTITDEGLVLVKQVVAPEAAWLVIRTADGILGAAAVNEGDNADVEVEIDPLLADDTLEAILYSASGGELDSEVDEPLLSNGAVVSAEFAVERLIRVPSLQVADQIVRDDGKALVTSINMIDNGWLAIYTAADTDYSNPVGLTYLERGTYRDVIVPMAWRSASPALVAVLHVDEGEIGRFDADDAVQQVQFEPVQAAFSATFPPELVIWSQPAVTGQIVIDRVLASRDGWVAVMLAVDEETPGNIIGFAQIEAGLNERVAIDIRRDLATDTLFLQMHEDTGELGEFDFPAFDSAIRLDGEPVYFTLDTQPGNYAAATDQTIAVEDGTATVIVPVVVGDIPMWVTVREASDSTTQLGDILGAAPVEAGISYDVAIEIELDDVPSQLEIVLHQEASFTVGAGDPDEFDFPNGPDTELVRNSQPIRIPFFVFEE